MEYFYFLNTCNYQIKKKKFKITVLLNIVFYKTVPLKSAMHSVDQPFYMYMKLSFNHPESKYFTMFMSGLCTGQFIAHFCVNNPWCNSWYRSIFDLENIFSSWKMTTKTGHKLLSNIYQYCQHFFVPPTAERVQTHWHMIQSQSQALDIICFYRNGKLYP